MTPYTMSQEPYDSLSRKRKRQIQQVLYQEQLLEDLPPDLRFQAADSVIPKSMTAKTDTVFELYQGDALVGILHLEYQDKNVADMAVRMLGYGGNIVQHYQGIRVYQHVVYTGAADCTMVGELEQPYYTYTCKINALNAIAFSRFLNKADPAYWPMAILGDWQGHTAEEIIAQVINKFAEAGIDNQAEAEEIIQEFITFGAMRQAKEMVKQKLRTMADVFPHYRDTDIFKELQEEYRQEAKAEGKEEGKAEGMKKGRAEEREKAYQEKLAMAQRMKQDGLPIASIAKYTGLSQEEINKA